jgi:DNA/RNA endonuclease G (NUC1)
MKNLLLTLLLTLPLFVFSQKPLRDSIYIKTNMFEIVYSEKLQQPKFIRYTVQCPNGAASRKGMDFYTCDSILTSDNLDYVNNPYDKGHLAPAASFSCDRETLYKTFTYLNCSLQQENLNRTTWRLLEERERQLAKTNKVVIVEIRCVYSPKSIVLPSGATIPDGYFKTIKYGKTIEKYYFKNEKPLSTDFTKYQIKL